MLHPTEDTLRRRLRLVRERAGLSLRAFAASLADRAGYRVSHSTVREYERRGSAPAVYVRAVSLAFGSDPAWLLHLPDEDGVLDGREARVEEALQGIAGILNALVEELVEVAEGT